MKYSGWIFLFFIVLYIIPLGSRPMLTEEIAFAQIAVEMVESGEYTAAGGLITPDVPPMSYWFMAASFNLFGVNSFAARLPFALAAGITALMIALLVQQNLRDEKLAALASMIYMSFSLVFFGGSIADTGMISIMAISVTLGLIFLSVQEKQFNRRKILLLALAGLAASLGFLSTGFTALLLPLLIMVPFLIKSRQIKELALIIPAVLIFALLPSLPWILSMMENKEIFMIFISPSVFYDSFGSYPWYSYLLLLAAGIFPVWVLVPCAMLTGKESWKRLFRQPICQFASFSLIIPLIWFTICRNEYPGIIQICFPALSLLIPLGIQAYFNTGGHHRSFDWMINIWALLLTVSGLASVAFWFCPGVISDAINSLPLSKMSPIIFGVSSLLGGIALLCSWRGNWRSRLYLFFFSIAILPLGISWCITPNRFMPEKTIRAFLSDCPKGCPVFTSPELISAVKWCGADKVGLIDCGCEVLEAAENAMVCVIVEKNDPVLQKFESEKKTMLSADGLSCIKFIPAAAGERGNNAL